MTYHPRRNNQALKTGVIGLGAGTIAVYGQQLDTIRFYEINPAVDRISSQYFSYRRGSPPKIENVPGGARPGLESETPPDYDPLGGGAFTNHAGPVDLLPAGGAPGERPPRA